MEGREGKSDGRVKEEGGREREDKQGKGKGEGRRGREGTCLENFPWTVVHQCAKHNYTLNKNDVCLLDNSEEKISNKWIEYCFVLFLAFYKCIYANVFLHSPFLLITATAVFLLLAVSVPCIFSTPNTCTDLNFL